MRILFSVMGTHGLVYPAVGIALELQAAGFTVGIATDRSFEGAIQRAGAEYVAGPDPHALAFRMKGWGTGQVAAAQLLYTLSAFRSYKPDVLVASPFALASIALARVAEMRTAVLGQSVFPLPGSEDALRHPLSGADRQNAERFREFTGMYRSVCDRAGLPADAGAETIEDSPLLGDVYLLQSVPSLARGVLPSKVRLVGSCLWEPSEDLSEDDRAWLEAGHALPLLYVQQGRTFEKEGFWDALMRVAARRGIRIAASTSRMDRPGEPGEVSGPHLIKDHLGQSAILPHAAGVFCSATATPALGAITHGLPCAFVPGGSGQAELAAEWRRAGIGVVMPLDRVSDELVAATLDQLLNDVALRSQCRVIQQEFAAYHGAVLSANHIAAMAGVPADVILRHERERATAAG